MKALNIALFILLIIVTSSTAQAQQDDTSTLINDSQAEIQPLLGQQVFRQVQPLTGYTASGRDDLTVSFAPLQPGERRFISIPGLMVRVASTQTTTILVSAQVRYIEGARDGILVFIDNQQITPLSLARLGLFALDNPDNISYMGTLPAGSHVIEIRGLVEGIGLSSIKVGPRIINVLAF